MLTKGFVAVKRIFTCTPRSVSWGNSPQNRARSTSANGFICSVDGFSCSVDGFSCSLQRPRSSVGDKVCQVRALSRSGNGKFCSAAANCRFGEGRQSLPEGNVCRADSRTYVDSPISRFRGVNKTVGGANQTIDGANQTSAEAKKTSEGATKTIDGASRTSAEVKKTFEGVNGTISGASKTTGRASKTVNRANETADSALSGARPMLHTEIKACYGLDSRNVYVASDSFVPTSNSSRRYNPGSRSPVGRSTG